MLSYAHTLHPEREVPERGKFVENLNAPVKSAHAFSFLPPFLLLSRSAGVYVMSHPYCTLSLFSLSPPLVGHLTKQSQLRAF